MSHFCWSVLPLFLLTYVASTSDLFAQVRGSPTQPESSRGRIGILGAIREARDERFNRANPPPTPPAKPSVSSQAIKPNGPNGPQNPNISSNRIATQQPGRGTNQQPSRPNPTRPTPFGNTLPGQSSPPAARSRSYPPTIAQQNPTRVQGADFTNPSKPRSPLNVTPVVAASAVVPNRLPYTGSGIVIRLPAELAAEVNYLVDDAEQLVLHSGEEHRLRLKGKYDVRFSRGVTDDQRSLGEARYSLNEGAYQFFITDKGWDLQREPIAPNPFDAANTLVPRPVELEKRQAVPVPVETATEESLPAPIPEPTAVK